MVAGSRMPSWHGINALAAADRAGELASCALHRQVAGESVNHHLDATLAIETFDYQNRHAVLSHVGESHRRPCRDVSHSISLANCYGEANIKWRN